MKNPDLSQACALEPLPDFREYPKAEMIERARAFMLSSAAAALFVISIHV